MHAKQKGDTEMKKDFVQLSLKAIGYGHILGRAETAAHLRYFRAHNAIKRLGLHKYRVECDGVACVFQSR